MRRWRHFHLSSFLLFLSFARVSLQAARCPRWVFSSVDCVGCWDPRRGFDVRPIVSLKVFRRHRFSAGVAPLSFCRRGCRWAVCHCGHYPADAMLALSGVPMSSLSRSPPFFFVLVLAPVAVSISEDVARAGADVLALSFFPGRRSFLREILASSLSRFWIRPLRFVLSITLYR